MPTVVLSPSRRRQLDVLPPGTLRSSGMSPDDARWALAPLSLSPYLSLDWTAQRRREP